MTLWTRLYEHNDYRGRSTFASLSSSPASNTYLQIDKSWLDAQNLHDRVSSLEFGASSFEKGGHLILFQHAGYKGRYARFAATPGATVSRPNLTAQSFNDITSSVLLVRKHTREMPPMALGGMGTPTLRDQIAAEVAATPNISMRGTPVISWDMWPSFASSQKFVYVAIPSSSMCRTGSTTMPKYASGSISTSTRPGRCAAMSATTAPGSKAES